MACRVVALVTVFTVFQVAAVAVQDPPVTLGSVVEAVATAREQASFHEVDPERDARLEEDLATLRESQMLDATAVDIANAMHRPHVRALARLPSGLLTPRVFAAIDRVQTAVNRRLGPALDDAVGAAEADRILHPLTRLHAALLEASIANSEEILARYERKFGPDSARLNGLEVALNYGLQRLPQFGPDEDGAPGPFEAIASYSPTYMTYATGEARMVSVTEFGLRRYLFGEQWGRRGLMGLLRPAFLTFGLAVAGEEDGALRWPWKGDTRLGGFFSWGELKVAYVKGDDQRLMVTRQFQIVPWAF